MMTKIDFDLAKQKKLQEMSFIAAETLAQYIVCNRKGKRYLVTRDNNGFGDKRQWCLRFSLENGKSIVFAFKNKNPRLWTEEIQNNLTPLLEKLEMC